MSKVSCLCVDRRTYSFRCNLNLAEGLTPPARPTTIGVTCMGGGRPCTVLGAGRTPGKEGHEQLRVFWHIRG